MNVLKPHKYCFSKIISNWPIIIRLIIKKLSSAIRLDNNILKFKEIIKKLLVSIDKKRILVNLPLFLARIIIFFLEKFPRPLITQDQLTLLKYDNIISKKYKSNLDIGYKAKLKFEDEIKKYSHMWRKGGEYSKKRD